GVDGDRAVVVDAHIGFLKCQPYICRDPLGHRNGAGDPLSAILLPRKYDEEPPMLAMNTLVDRLSVPAAGPVPPSADADKMPKSAIADDMAMIRAASELTRDLVQPSPRIYWTDFLASTFIGYAGIAAAIFAPSTAW